MSQKHSCESWLQRTMHGKLMHSMSVVGKHLAQAQCRFVNKLLPVCKKLTPNWSKSNWND